MTIDIKEFREPVEHKSFLSGVSHEYTHEKEKMLIFALSQNILIGGWQPVICKDEHPTMVKEGLFVRCEEFNSPVYRLTEKAIGLLYSVYHK